MWCRSATWPSAFTDSRRPTAAICDTPVIGDINQAFMPDVEDLTINAMKDF
jgi:hypothetical protein